MVMIPPGSMPMPIVPPMQPKKSEATTDATKDKPLPSKTSVSREAYQMYSQGLAVRMAALAHDAKEKELSFDEIIEKVIKDTGLINPQSAMEESNRKLQKEIDDEIKKIMENKDLMEEAESWQELAGMLQSQMSEDQVGNFVVLLEQEIKGIA